MYLMKGLKAFALFLAVAVLAGCGTLPNGRGWGQDATLFPGWRRVRDAAVNAVTDPATWAPAAGALVLQVDDMDGNLSDWATDHMPLFGSQEDAERAPDLLNTTAHASYLVTALLTPSGDKDVWLNAKLKGIGVGFAAMMTTCGTTFVLKDTISLTRPDGSNDRSFPSGHASSAATATMLASKNVEYLTLSNPGKTVLRAGLTTLPFAVGWARVEANKHYPSDVLFGIALGNFFGAFFNDAFLGIDSHDSMTVTIEPSKEGVMVGLTWTF